MGKTLQLLCIISIVFFLISLSVFPLEDSDIWFHLKAGEWIWQNKKLPCPDPFSWSIKDLCWIDPEWGVQVLLHGVKSLDGLDGVIIAKAALITATFLGLLLFQIRLTGFSLWGVLLLTIGILASADRFMERVEHIGFFFLMLSVGILFWWRGFLSVYPQGGKFISHYKIKVYLPLVVLPIISILWVNTHPSVALGIVLFVLFLGGEIVVAIITNLSRVVTYKKVSFLFYFFIRFINGVLDKKALSKKALMLLGLGTALLTSASFINPYGLLPILTPFKVGGTAYLANIIEWQSPFAPAHQETPYTQFFLLTLSLYWVTLIIGWLRNGIRLGPALILLGVSYLGLTRVRHINVFVLAGFLPVMTSLSSEGFGIQKLRVNLLRLNRNYGKHQFLNHEFGYKLALLLCILSFTGSASHIIRNGYKLGRVYRTFGLGQRPIFAQKALDFLDEHKINGNLFNGYGLGGYVIYAGYPERTVFMDGRAHYPEELFLEHSQVNKSAKDAQEILDKYKIDYVIILHPEEGGTGLADFLSDDKKNWSLIYWDQYYLVYLRRKPPECQGEANGSELKRMGANEQMDCENWHNVIAKYEYAYADPIRLRRPEMLEELSRTGKEALKTKVRTRGELERNLEITPNNNRARVLLGGVLEMIPDIQEAKKVYEDIVRREPKFALGHFLLGNLLIQEARNIYETPSLFREKEATLTVSPKELLTLKNGKQVKKTLWEAGKTELQKAYTLDKSVVHPLVILGNIVYEEGNLDEAEKFWRKANDINPNDSEANYQLGVLYANEKFDRERAKNHLERYLLLTSGETVERERAKVILERLGR